MNCTVCASTGVASAEEKTKVAAISSSPRTGYLDINSPRGRKANSDECCADESLMAAAETDASWVARYQEERGLPMDLLVRMEQECGAKCEYRETLLTVSTCLNRRICS